jgi:hypothetical protein
MYSDIISEAFDTSIRACLTRSQEIENFVNVDLETEDLKRLILFRLIKIETVLQSEIDLFYENLPIYFPLRNLITIFFCSAEIDILENVRTCKQQIDREFNPMMIRYYYLQLIKADDAVIWCG